MSTFISTLQWFLSGLSIGFMIAGEPNYGIVLVLHAVLIQLCKPKIERE